jgi:predicted nucleic acid-binding protein
MATIVLDTNVLSELMRPQPDPAVMGWFAAAGDTIYSTTAITKAEIMLGISLLPAGKRRDTLLTAAEAMFMEDFAGRILPFDEQCAEFYAPIVANRRRAGFTLTTEDAQIAATVLVHGFELATRNTRDFMHIDGLKLHNPWNFR